MNTYIADLKAYIGNLKQSSSYSRHFREYKISQDKKCLVAKENIKTDKPSRHESPALLFAFIGLVRPPLPQFFKDKNKEPMRTAVPDKNILKFCRRFGMPYIDGNNGKDHLPAIDDFIQGLAVIPQALLELDHFRYKVAWLYTHFKVWHSLYSGQSKGGVLEEYANRNLVKEESTREAAAVLLGAEITMRLNNSRLTSEYNKESGSFTLGIRAQNLFDIAYFHLANLLTMKDATIQRHLKTCNNPQCNHLFWSEHGHSRYCELCDRRTIWSRKKKKEGNK